MGNPARERGRAWSREQTVRALARTSLGGLAAPRPHSRFVEIDSVRHWFPAAIANAAEARAGALDVGADEVLVAAGYLTELTYIHAQADALALDFLDLDQTPAEACPLAGETLVLAARAGLLPIRFGGTLRWVVALQGPAMRRFVEFLAREPTLRRRVILASPQQLRRFVERNASGSLAYIAAHSLRDERPLASAAHAERRLTLAAVATGVIVGAGLATAPHVIIQLTMLAISVLFAAWGAMRLIAALTAPRPETSTEPERLPTYTIVAALYREAAALPGLLDALRALDYPAEKRQIVLVLEADDHATREAVAAFGARDVEVILSPPGDPRTKPKALNAALPMARGELIVVYDAEDRPEVSQLREAAALFAGDERGTLGCVQARLTIDNSRDSWLTFMFTAEYAAQFDVILPGMAARGWPLPLGGSSNHLRTDVVREIGAWDPYNVTEDADLGLRLARHGYRTAVASSSTYEEAPARALPWMRQRTRWFKGWLQTWCVHMREPRRLYREVGGAGVLTLQLFLVGTVFAALLQPIGWALVFGALIWPDAWRAALGAPPRLILAFHVLAMIGGYAVSFVVAIMGLRRRRLLTRRAMILLPGLMIGHWMMLSVAAWRALFQFFFNRFHWEKTEHGLARSSRRGGAELGTGASEPD